MICLNCNSTDARIWRKREDGTESCNNCSDVRRPVAYDVYFKEPYYDENLANKENPHGRWVPDKKTKAQYMKEKGIREAGDKVRGARTII